MQAALDKLNAAQLQAQADVNGWFTTVGASVLGTGSSQDAQNTALDATNNRIAVLASVEWNKIFSGEETVAQFLANAQTTFNTIQSVDADVGNWSLNGVIASTVSQTVTDVKKDVVIGGIAIAPLVILAVVIVAVLYLGPLVRVAQT